MNSIKYLFAIKAITGFILASIATVILLSYTALFNLDYNLLFFVVFIITGVYWILNILVWKQHSKENNPWWISWTSDIFVMVAFIFLFRGFIAEPFRVPTGSMLPTIQIGDLGVISKFSYDIKIPVFNTVLFKVSDIERGEVLVFKNPQNESILYIKRVIALPNDKIKYDYDSKTIFINDVKITQTFFKEVDNIKEYKETIGNHKHSIFIDSKNGNIPDPFNTSFKNSDKCKYTYDYMECIVPKDNYFAMGDNRDYSLDSRYWGFFPHENIIGKATYILYSKSGSLKPLN